MFEQLLEQRKNGKGFLYGCDKKELDKLVMKFLKLGIPFTVIKSERFGDLWYISSETLNYQELVDRIRTIRGE